MSNLLGLCPLGRINCKYADSHCSDCIKYETEKKRQKKRQNRKGGEEE